jgi:hypothetical protein
MTSDQIVGAIRAGALGNEELQTVASATLSALFADNDVDSDVVADLDTSAGGRFTHDAVEEYRENESVHELIRLLVARTQPGRICDLVHEVALHHWQQDGLQELLRTFESIKRDIRQQERMGLAEVE